MAKTQTYAAITPEKRKEWEARYGTSRIHDIEVQTPEGKNCFVILKPTRKVMELVAQAGDRDIATANQAFIANCVLGGDMDAIDYDGQVYLALLEYIGALIQQKQIKVKKL
ncbi:MAG: hypothetical protein V6Z82_04760 [Flavobacteriales bacterium]